MHMQELDEYFQLIALLTSEQFCGQNNLNLICQVYNEYFQIIAVLWAEQFIIVQSSMHMQELDEYFQLIALLTSEQFCGQNNLSLIRQVCMCESSMSTFK